VTATAEDSLVLDASVDAAIETCGGDARAAVRALILANNYLEAEVKRLAEAVSSGFTRGFTATGRAAPVFPHFKGDRTKWRQDIDSRFPHSVDLAPPEDGFPDAVERQIVEFLVPLFGRYELYADVQGNEPLIRYCFAQAEDAAAFHTAFASAALKSHYKKAG
jgi:hypothetical protein